VDFTVLFERLYPTLYRYLYRLTGDADAAEDVAQEAFVRLWRQSLSEKDAKPWLFTVATNLVRDGARASTRRRRLLTTAPVGPVPLRRPDEELEDHDRIAAVRSALDRIPPRDRQILLMREEGFRHAEIARVIGVAPSSVGTLAARALRRFVKAYEADEDGNGTSN
jgi:RNA polymerase sigma-70 factor, ECF subfamily